VAAAADSILALVGDIFESLPVAVLVVDAERRIVMANRELEALLGYRRRELLGQALEILLPEAVRAAHAAYHRSYLDAPVARRMGENRDLLARRADGSTIPVEIALKPMQGADGPVVIAAILDLSARKALERQSREANAELERRVRERTAELERSNRDKQQMLEALERARADMERLSRLDSLTGLANRREFEQRLAEEKRFGGRREERPLCLAMFDLDHFKRVNDRFGHALGDEVLRQLGAILQRQCRVADIVSRHGGEEFALALPDTAIEESLAICERIRRAVAAHDWSRLQAGLQVTISAGVVQRLPGESNETALARADRLLYQAKRRGRDRVESQSDDAIYPGPDEGVVRDDCR
jgi:diguanylate cyclase (GGDEF)-like protein/PAS domain S-box-containing protein